MPGITPKEWAAAQAAIEAARRADERRRLPAEPVADSLKAYFALSQFLVQLSPDAEEAFVIERSQHYNALMRQWQRIARRHGYDFPA